MNRLAEPEWHRIAREWQDPGQGAPLASLASNAWTPPLTLDQIAAVTEAASAITDLVDRMTLLDWLVSDEALGPED